MRGAGVTGDRPPARPLGLIASDHPACWRRMVHDPAYVRDVFEQTEDVVADRLTD